jgi:hypothetical protein
MSGESQLLLMIAGVHLVGLACVAVLMFSAFRAGEAPPSESTDTESDEGGGNQPRHPRGPSERPWGGVPLPDAEQARVRLRDHRKLGSQLPARQRRPAREPGRTPVKR